MLIQTRRRIAGKFGRIEHTAGEVLGIVSWGSWFYEKTTTLLCISIIWSVYFVSHRLEKKFYGKYGPRG